MPLYTRQVQYDFIAQRSSAGVGQSAGEKEYVVCPGDPHNTRGPPTQCADPPQAAADVLYVRTHGALGFQRPFVLRCARRARDLMTKFISNAEVLVLRASFRDPHGFSGWALNINQLF